jgi:membrane protein involved in colicin uptake
VPKPGEIQGVYYIGPDGKKYRYKNWKEAAWKLNRELVLQHISAGASNIVKTGYPGDVDIGVKKPDVTNYFSTGETLGGLLISLGRTLDRIKEIKEANPHATAKQIADVFEQELARLTGKVKKPGTQHRALVQFMGMIAGIPELMALDAHLQLRGSTRAGNRYLDTEFEGKDEFMEALKRLNPVGVVDKKPSKHGTHVVQGDPVLQKFLQEMLDFRVHGSKHFDLPRLKNLMLRMVQFNKYVSAHNIFPTLATEETPTHLLFRTSHRPIRASKEIDPHDIVHLTFEVNEHVHRLQAKILKQVFSGEKVKVGGEELRLDDPTSVEQFLGDFLQDAGLKREFTHFYEDTKQDILKYATNPPPPPPVIPVDNKDTVPPDVIPVKEKTKKIKKKPKNKVHTNPISESSDDESISEDEDIKEPEDNDKVKEPEKPTTTPPVNTDPIPQDDEIKEPVPPKGVANTPEGNKVDEPVKIPLDDGTAKVSTIPETIPIKTTPEGVKEGNKEGVKEGQPIPVGVSTKVPDQPIKTPTAEQIAEGQRLYSLLTNNALLESGLQEAATSDSAHRASNVVAHLANTIARQVLAQIKDKSLLIGNTNWQGLINHAEAAIRQRIANAKLNVSPEVMFAALQRVPLLLNVYQAHTVQDILKNQDELTNIFSSPEEIAAWKTQLDYVEQWMAKAEASGRTRSLLIPREVINRHKLQRIIGAPPGKMITDSIWTGLTYVNAEGKPVIANHANRDELEPLRFYKRKEIERRRHEAEVKQNAEQKVRDDAIAKKAKADAEAKQKQQQAALEAANKAKKAKADKEREDRLQAQAAKAKADRAAQAKAKAETERKAKEEQQARAKAEAQAAHNSILQAVQSKLAGVKAPSLGAGQPLEQLHNLVLEMGEAANRIADAYLNVPEADRPNSVEALTKALNQFAKLSEDLTQAKGDPTTTYSKAMQMANRAKRIGAELGARIAEMFTDNPEVQMLLDQAIGKFQQALPQFTQMVDQIQTGGQGIFGQDPEKQHGAWGDAVDKANNLAGLIGRMSTIAHIQGTQEGQAVRQLALAFDQAVGIIPPFAGVSTSQYRATMMAAALKHAPTVLSGVVATIKAKNPENINGQQDQLDEMISIIDGEAKDLAGILKDPDIDAPAAVKRDLNDFIAWGIGAQVPLSTDTAQRIQSAVKQAWQAKDAVKTAVARSLEQFDKSAEVKARIAKQKADGQQQAAKVVQQQQKMDNDFVPGTPPGALAPPRKTAEPPTYEAPKPISKINFAPLDPFEEAALAKATQQKAAARPVRPGARVMFNPDQVPAKPQPVQQPVPQPPPQVSVQPVTQTVPAQPPPQQAQPVQPAQPQAQSVRPQANLSQPQTSAQQPVQDIMSPEMMQEPPIQLQQRRFSAQPEYELSRPQEVQQPVRPRPAYLDQNPVKASMEQPQVEAPSLRLMQGYGARIDREKEVEREKINSAESAQLRLRQAEEARLRREALVKENEEKQAQLNLERWNAQQAALKKATEEGRIKDPPYSLRKIMNQDNTYIEPEAGAVPQEPQAGWTPVKDPLSSNQRMELQQAQMAAAGMSYVKPHRTKAQQEADRRLEEIMRKRREEESKGPRQKIKVGPIGVEAGWNNKIDLSYRPDKSRVQERPTYPLPTLPEGQAYQNPRTNPRNIVNYQPYEAPTYDLPQPGASLGLNRRRK